MSWREGDFRRGVEIEIGWKTVLGGDVNGGGRLVGVVRTGLPLLGLQEELASRANHGEKQAGTLKVDHPGSDGFSDLRESGLHGVHILERRQLEGEALVARTGLGAA